jgi:glycerol uptake facilitator protein
MSQKFTAEIIGTAILVFIGAGSVPLTVFLTGSNPFGSAELSTISFCFAFAIFAAVYAVGHISGAHINPAVTIALLATRKIDSRTAGIYIVAQVIGAIVGALLTYVILIGNDPAKLGLGAVTYNPDTSGVAIALAAETIGTAILAVVLLQPQALEEFQTFAYLGLVAFAFALFVSLYVLYRALRAIPTDGRDDDS